MPDSGVQAHLRRARARLFANGWRQGPEIDFDDLDGPMCAAYTIYNTRIETDPQPLCWSPQSAWGVLLRQIVESGGMGDEKDITIGAWNDRKGRTFAEVVAMFDQAIHSLDDVLVLSD